MYLTEGGSIEDLEKIMDSKTVDEEYLKEIPEPPWWFL